MKHVCACTLDCPGTCSLLVETATDGRVSVRGHPDHPFTAGRCCSKGAAVHKRLTRPDRVTAPLLRQGNDFVPIAWDTALDMCAERIRDLKDDPLSLAHFRGHGYRGALAQASSQFFKHLGATGLRGSLCDDTGIEACLRDFGALETNDPADLANATRIVNWGKDLSRSSIHVAALVKSARKQGARVLTISPGGDGNAPFSDWSILVRPGGDRFLALAALRILLDRGGLSQRHLARTANWDRFRQILAGLDPNKLCACCDCLPADAKVLADWYGGDAPVASIMGWGLQRHVYGGENVRCINALAMASGQVGVSGGGSYFNIASGRNLAQGWAPEAAYGRTLLLPQLTRELAAADPPVRFAWVDGHNIVNQVPEAEAMARAFEAIPFTVVADAFMNDTAMRADLVLPAALSLEHEEVIGSCLHNYLNYGAKALDPPGQTRSDFDIMADLACRLGLEWPTAKQWLRNALDNVNVDVSLEELRQQGWTRGAHPIAAFADLQFGHDDGLYRFPEAVNKEPPLPEDYPLQLLTLVRRGYIHSQIPPEDQEGPPELTLSAAWPGWQNFAPGDCAWLVTPLGKLRAALTRSDDLHPIAAIVRRGGWMARGWSANPVIEPRITDMGESAAYYSQPCRVEPE